MKRSILIISLITTLFSCVTAPQKDYIQLNGEAQGTTFFISYFDSLETDYSGDIQQILEDFDQELSTYKPGSFINKFNSNEIDTITINEYYFWNCYSLAEDMKKYTNGYFNHGLQSLIQISKEAEKRGEVLPKEIRDSLISIPTLIYSYNHMGKFDKRTQFNFNAIAQGYSVDVICQFLDSKGVKNYMVEIGGEVRVKGNSPTDKPWTVSLESPDSKVDNREVQETITLPNMSVVTSGSYRKFKEIDGVKYSHAINPKTGLGVTHNLLSVSVITKECAIADALATAFLVMGKEKTIEFLEKDNKYNVSLLFIESDTNGNYLSSFYGGFEDYLVK